MSGKNLSDWLLGEFKEFFRVDLDEHTLLFHTLKMNFERRELNPDGKQRNWVFNENKENMIIWEWRESNGDENFENYRKMRYA